MGEASGIEEIRQAMENLYQRTVETKSLDTTEIASVLEPLYQKHGYREQVNTGGGHLRILLYHDDGVGDFIDDLLDDGFAADLGEKIGFVHGCLLSVICLT